VFGCSRDPLGRKGFRRISAKISAVSYDDDETEDRAPICPYCGVTALPADPSNVIDTRFMCENPDCEAFGDEVA